MLPPFPVDNGTLDLLDAALDPWSHGNPAAESSHLHDFLEYMSAAAGSDVRAVEEEFIGETPVGVMPVQVLRDPQYSDHCLLRALIADILVVRRLTGAPPAYLAIPYDGTGLPPWPTDDATLDLLLAAMDPRGHGDPQATTSSVWPLMQMMDRLGGSDPQAVEEEISPGLLMMRDASYHINNVIKALADELRAQRAIAAERGLALP